MEFRVAQNPAIKCPGIVPRVTLQTPLAVFFRDSGSEPKPGMKKKNEVLLKADPKSLESRALSCDASSLRFHTWKVLTNWLSE